MKKIIIALLLALAITAPSYAWNDPHPIKNFIKKVKIFLRGSPFDAQRRQIQKEYDSDKISKQEYDDRLADIDRQEEAYKEMQLQAAEQRAQAAAQQAGQ